MATCSASLRSSNTHVILVDDGDGRFPNLPLLQIIQYLDPMERCALSATGKLALEQVELYCKLLLQAITGPGNQNVDDSFHQRIRSRNVSCTTEAPPKKLPKKTPLPPAGAKGKVKLFVSICRRYQNRHKRLCRGL
jgi:hypothetical protein